MTFRKVTRDEVLAALGNGGEDSVLRACVAALRLCPRPSYVRGLDGASALPSRTGHRISNRIARIPEMSIEKCSPTDFSIILMT